MYDNIATNDWQDLVYGRTGHTFNHNININGGTENIKYAFSYAHMNDKAIQIGSSFKRDNFSLKLNTKLDVWHGILPSPARPSLRNGSLRHSIALHLHY